MPRRPSSTSAPTFIEPMAAQPTTALPEGEEWLYELKMDGYRALLIKDAQRLELRSRKDKDLSRMFPTVVAAGRRLAVSQVVLDGEIVALDGQGRPSFQALQHRTAHPQHPIVYYVFDVLHREGRDLTQDSLHQRRTWLPTLTDGNVLRVSHELPGTTVQIVQAVRAMGLEGVVAKRRGSRYAPGHRSSDWVKLKLDRQQEFVIGGYRPASSSSVDVLLVGYHDGAVLRFAAKVHAGLIAHSRRELAKLLKPLHTPTCPFADLPSGGSRWGGGVGVEEMREMHWTRPEVVVQVRFVEWTAENRLRHPTYAGLRSDKAASEVRREL